MAELPASTSSEDGPPTRWKRSSQRSRKSGCPNIFTGVNLQQLRRLFRKAGDQDAEHRAKLVWRGMSAEKQRTDEAMEEEGEDMEEEVGLAQALVGLRVRARNKAGIRAEGNRDHRWLRTSGYLRIDEPLPSYTVGDEEADVVPSSGEFRPTVEEDTREIQNPLKASSPRLGMARREGARHSEHYLHRILH
ncbi:avpi1 [Pungitius sinensis]